MRSDDTTEQAHRVQIEVWRRMGGGRTAELSLEMSEAMRQVTLDGIRARQPHYDEEQLRHALYRLTLGDALYTAAWPGRPLLDP